MKTRYFSLFEKIQIFYSNSLSLTDKAIWFFFPPLFVLMMASPQLSNTYVYETDVAANSGKANSLHLDHTIDPLGVVCAVLGVSE